MFRHWSILKSIYLLHTDCGTVVCGSWNVVFRTEQFVTEDFNIPCLNRTSHFGTEGESRGMLRFLVDN